MKNDNTLIIVIVVILALFLLGGFGGMGGMMPGMMSGTYGFGGMWLLGWLFMILIIVALVLLSSG